MAKDNDEQDRVRKSAASSVKKLLSNRGMDLAQCGVGVFRESLPAFDPLTGYWSKPSAVTPKPPRWIVWLERLDDEVIARVPAVTGADRLAFINTAQGRVGGIFVRVVPAIRTTSGDWTLHLNWEWVLFFIMPQPMRAGSAAQLMDKFRPAEGRFKYLYNTDETDPATNRPRQAYDEPKYTTAGLFGLVSPADIFEETSGAKSISYSEATAALQRLINVFPEIPNVPAQLS